MSLDSGGFIDLRLNRQDRQNQDGFWPSFTDIMTVIVMIFLIAMVVLLLRNMELVKQLRATMEAERSAMELARTTGEEKESLALKLIATENELSMLRIKMMRLEEERTKQAATIGTQDQEISKLLAAKEELTLRRDQLVAENYSLSENLKRAKSNISNLQQSLATLKQNFESSQEQLLSSQRELAETQAELSSLETERSALEIQLSSLRARYNEQATELLTTKAASRLTDTELATLRSDFANLKIKYDELVRPARTPEGRFVVEVRYGKSNGKYTIEYQTSEEPGYRKLSREVLEQKLTRLKREKKNGLYVKVIFPEESGLSFNEAWSFTAKLHERFDYYFQKNSPKLVPAPAAEE